MSDILTAYLVASFISAVLVLACCVASSRGRRRAERHPIHSTPQVSHRPGKSGVTEEAGGQSNHPAFNYIQEQQHHG